MTDLRILVIGIGGIGGVLSALVREADTPGLGALVGYTTNTAVLEQVSEHGLRLGGIEADRVVPAELVADLSGLEPFDFIVLAVPPARVEEAARTGAGVLRPDGAMICLQNGLCEARVARIVGDDRVFGAVVAWGAEMSEPGWYRRTSLGGFTIGRFDGEDDDRLYRLAAVLEAVGPVKITQNLAGARYSKLAINCGISTLGTLGGERLGILMRLRIVRRLTLELMSEVVAVGQAEGVAFEKVAGTLDLPWLALTEQDRASTGSASLLAKHTMLLAVGTRYRRLRSSMLYALERGRDTGIDFLCGEIIERGERLGIPTPVNEAGLRRVKELTAGVRKPSIGEIESFAREAGIRV